MEEIKKEISSMPDVFQMSLDEILKECQNVINLGIKAINPVYETRKEHYPIIHPKLGRDMSLHFAVGMPF